MPGFLPIDAGEWPVAHWQGMLIAQYARTCRDQPAAAETYLAGVPAIPLTPAARHRPWDRVRYLRDLERDIRTLEGSP